ncbi:MAG: EAL domain-containing protein [Myxococcota bacterium]
MNPDVRLLRQALDVVQEGVLFIDDEGRVQWCNQTLALWGGFAAEAIEGQAWAQVFDEAPGLGARGAVEDALRTGRSSILTPALHEGPLPLTGPRLAHRLRQRLMVEPVDGGCLLRVQDASELLDREARLAAQRSQLEQQQRALRQQEDAIKRAAHFDAVTGLLNRGQLQQLMTEAVVRATEDGGKGAVVVFDIDGWRQVNESFGTGTADGILRRLGNRLTRTLRAQDVVGRLGADVFLAILEDLDSGEAKEIIRTALLCLQRPMLVDGQELSVTASGGVTFYPRHGKEPEGLIAQAEMAVRQAKRQGRNSLQVFTRGMRHSQTDRARLLSALQRATDAQDFRLVYQPQIDLETRAVSGVEALLRWSHPEHGPVGPDRFVPILEDSGLIHQVGTWVLHEACRQAVIWRDAGMSLRVAVNVSAHQFLARAFDKTVLGALEEHGLEPELLEVELTESLLMQDVTASRRMLEALSKEGLQLAVDDFGTGYSSLAHLRRFPVDALKIDRAFTSEVHEPEGQAIVRTIIGLGSVLDLRVVAEGVETEEQADFLRNEGCHDIQGYWAGRPMEPLTLATWYRTWPRGQVPGIESQLTVPEARTVR